MGWMLLYISRIFRSVDVAFEIQACIGSIEVLPAECTSEVLTREFTNAGTSRVGKVED